VTVQASRAGSAGPVGYAGPARYHVVARQRETHDTVTLALRPVDEPIAAHRPGQFTMLYALGVGEVPISISGPPDGPDLIQTIRSVGAVSRALCAAEPGQVLGVRGPFGTDWGAQDAAGASLLVVAGGIGLAPLRGAVLEAMAARERYRRITVLVGSRSPEEIVFGEEFDAWREAGVDVQVTVDRAAGDWRGNVGVVTQLLDRAEINPMATLALVCGPEIMMRLTARDLHARGIPARDIRVSLERNMRCGVAECGHCQLGPLLLCRDGPVVDYERAAPLLTIREL